MAGLAESGANPDVDLLYGINGLAKGSPHWLDRFMEHLGSYGLPLLIVLLALWCWLSTRRRAASAPDDLASSFGALVWGPVAAGLAVLVNVPIRAFVARPHPAAEHEGIDVLAGGTHSFSFVSDHATVVMALGVAMFMADRRFGVFGILCALLTGFSQVYLGAYYPTDVLGGFALGAAVALLLAPLAAMLFIPLFEAAGRSARTRWLVRARPAPPAGRDTVVAGSATAGRQANVPPAERDLAA